MRFEFHWDKYGIRAIRKKQGKLCGRGRDGLSPERRERLKRLIVWLNEAIDRFEEL